MNHLIQLEEKLDSIEFGARRRILKAVTEDGEARAKHYAKDHLKRRRKALTNLYDKSRGNVLHDVLTKKGAPTISPANTMATIRKLRASQSRDKRAAELRKLRKSRDAMKKLKTTFNSKLDSLFEFQHGGGVDPAIIQQVVNDAQSMGHEGETRVAISQQLFQKLNLALQEFYANKNHVDSQIVQQAIKQ